MRRSREDADSQLVIEVCGGEIVIEANFNTFELDPLDRVLVEKLIALADEHKKAKAKARTSQPTKADGDNKEKGDSQP